MQELINLRLRKRQGRCGKHQEGRKVDISTGRQTRRSTTKARAMNEVYEELETPKGGRKMSRTAKTKDFTNQEQSDKGRTRCWSLNRIMGRWKGDFDKLLNG